MDRIVKYVLVTLLSLASISGLFFLHLKVELAKLKKRIAIDKAVYLRKIDERL